MPPKHWPTGRRKWCERQQRSDTSRLLKFSCVLAVQLVDTVTINDQLAFFTARQVQRQPRRLRRSTPPLPPIAASSRMRTRTGTITGTLNSSANGSFSEDFVKVESQSHEPHGRLWRVARHRCTRRCPSGFDPGDLAREAHRDVQVAALPRQRIGSIRNARPRIDQDRTHVGSIDVQNLDFVRNPRRRPLSQAGRTRVGEGIERSTNATQSVRTGIERSV